MKQRKSIITMLAVLITLLIPQYIKAYDIHEGIFYYKVVSLADMTLEIESVDANIPNAVIIPDTVTVKGRKFTVINIGERVFRENANLKEVFLPATIDSIKSEAFSETWYFATINFPDGLQYIGEFAFSGSRVNTAIIPKSVKYIGYYGIQSADTLVKIEYSPDTLTLWNLGAHPKSFYIDRALNVLETYTNKPIVINNKELKILRLGPHAEWRNEYGGEYLQEVYVENTDPGKMVPSFPAGAYINATLHVPVGTKAAYEQAEGWKNFWTIVDDITTTGIEKPHVNNDISISVENGVISVSGLTPGERIFVYSINGSLINTALAQKGSATLSANNEKIVIVKTTHFSKKIQLK